MILAEGAWRMRQKSAPSKKPERKKGRPKKGPKQQQKLLLAKLRTRPELPESWRKRRKKEPRLSGTWQCFMLVLQFEKRWKEQPGAIAAEWQRRRLCSLSIQAQYFSKTNQDSREGEDNWNKASNERRRTKYAAKRAIPNSPMANSISSFSWFFQAQRPENSMAAVKWLVKWKSWSRPQACFQGN